MSSGLLERSDVVTGGGAVGERVNSKVGRRLVTGRGEFVDDIKKPGMLHARFVRSPHGHARVISIDTAAAEAIPGVELVWTAEDIDPFVEPFGHPSLDRPDERALATDRVRYMGDEVAITLARDRDTAVRAAEAVDVEYERLPAVTTPEAALAVDAPVLHPELDADPDCEVEGNLLYRSRVIAGDVEVAMTEADVVVEESFETNKTNPSPMEPHGCVAEYNPGDEALTLWSSNQNPHLLTEYLADAVVDLDQSQITCRMPDIGGGFGVKLELLSHEVCATVLAMATDRPVKIVLDRLEELQAGRGRHPESFDARLGVTADGDLLAFDVDLVQDTGAYGSFGKTVAFSASVTGGGPYRIPNQRFRGKVVYTNVMPGTAVRGYGDPQVAFAREQLVDIAADALDMDPIALRERNVPSPDDLPLTTATGLQWRDADMPTCLEWVREAIGWNVERGGSRTPDGKRRGVGVGTVLKRGGNKAAKGADFEAAIVKMDKHGSVTVFSGITSIGQGTETGIAQIVADVLGVSVDRVTPVVGHSDVTPDGMGVWADRGTIMGGTAAATAAEDLKGTLASLAAYRFDVEPDAVAFRDDRVFVEDDPDVGVSIDELAHIGTFGDPEERPPELRDGVSLVGDAKIETQKAELLDPETGTGNIAHGYTFGALAVVVEVDPGTGEIEVVDVASAEDVGRVINPTLVEGQIHGGIVHALGEVLLEDMVYDDAGQLENGTLVDYHLPTAADVPLVTKTHEVETPDRATSHGQKGVGECSIVPVGAAIANAVEDATGIRFTELPLSPDRVLPALVEHGLREV